MRALVWQTLTRFCESIVMTLFFYLYISVYNSLDKRSEKAKAVEANIVKWLKNDLVDFRISQVLKAIATAPQLRDAVLKFNLKESFQKIGDALNDYVHSNGYDYYNRNANSYRKTSCQLS